MDDCRKSLTLFFDRPMDPIFLKKGGDTYFFIPENYCPEEYKKLMESHSKDIKIEENANTTIKIPPIALPDFSIPLQLKKDESFTFFSSTHRQMAGKLIDIFMKAKTLEELRSLFAYSQMNINPYLFNYSASVALLHRSDTKGLDIPSFAETFPGKFINQKTLTQASKFSAMATKSCEIPYFDMDLPVNSANPEGMMSYFREDIGVNSHHWHWHLIYPTDAAADSDLIVKKDRRGELFYYMHHQIIARYNVDRICNNLPRTKPFVSFSEPIEEAYFPLLHPGNTTHAWCPRYENTTVRDIHRPTSGVHTSIADMERWRKQILTAIEDMSYEKADGTTAPLDEETGIDILGNIVEATLLSENPMLYGDYHNQGHMLIAYAHDPEECYNQQFSIMGDSGTAMRDPIFYRWHANIDSLFTMYKDKLTPYGPEKLIFPDIFLSSVSLQNADEQDTNNTLNTFWERSFMNLRNGLDYISEEKVVYVRLTHLQHEAFNYVINVSNASGRPQMGTVRIFLVPTVDETGQGLSFYDQRNLAIEMDKFSYELLPGDNTINRSSLDSSVTIPFERIFRNQMTKKTPEQTFCDCGWPQHLLVPKGTEQGFPMVLFVMISNWDEDKVDRDLTGADNDNASYCGLRDSKYPDRRAMGFPFDRKPAPGVDSIETFLQPNMAVSKCIIKFTDRTTDRNYVETKSKKESCCNKKKNSKKVVINQ